VHAALRHDEIKVSSDHDAGVFVVGNRTREKAHPPAEVSKIPS
jgi:hypothetical protein